jgi:FkbM family methyltransferase
MISYAQNFEDVLLARAFRGKTDGFYIDIGAMDDLLDSVTRHFYDLGWQGINIEPVDACYRKLVAGRPRDINLAVALGDTQETRELMEIAGTGLSSFRADYVGDPATAARRTVPVTTLARVCEEHVGERTVDFLKIDVEGWEEQVIRGADWQRFRPRVVVVEATAPNSPEPQWQSWEPVLLANRYLFAHFDGLNRFYVREEDAGLAGVFSLPPHVFDNFKLYRVHELEGDRRQLLQDVHTLEGDVARTYQEVVKTHRDVEEANGRAAQGLVDLDLTRQALDRTTQERELARQLLEDARRQIAGLTALCEDAGQQIAAINTAHATHLAAIDCQMTGLEGQVGQLHAERARLIEQLDDAIRQLHVVHAERAQLAAHATSVEDQLRQRNAALVRIHTSRVWHFTRPLRALEERLRSRR